MMMTARIQALTKCFPETFEIKLSACQIQIQPCRSFFVHGAQALIPLVREVLVSARMRCELPEDDTLVCIVQINSNKGNRHRFRQCFSRGNQFILSSWRRQAVVKPV